MSKKKTELSSWSENARTAHKKTEALSLFINYNLCPVDCKHCPFPVGKCIAIALEEIAANIAAANGRVKL